MFKGSGVAIITPFKDGKINYDKFEELLEWHVKEKTDAIIVCGTTGESATLSDEEKKELIKFTVEKINKRIPVIAGTGSNNTAHCIELSKYAQKVGADGLLIVTPYYNKTTQKGLKEHYLAIAQEVNIPIIIYNVPSRTGLNILPKTLAELSEHPNIRGVKEASGNIAQVAEIARLCKNNFCIYSGNDDMVVPLLSLGGLGVISVVANILPRDTHDMVSSYLNGNLKKAKDLQLNMKPLIDALFIETNPIPIKEAMNLLGMDVGPLRLPLTSMVESNKKILMAEMKSYGLKI
ncbi:MULTISPECIES: 4-hydroxy-tetrahydrodipicolinate synthase [Tissierellales]|jgi:4-hydroxy-tetrahydrodipicolinate synthase|uniref:4-hydroxy-tetrahydrodipicolinate synthase n=1 Tax=Acidilutibacter cellobiosedens TaxID=2507161 RepID=A0A410QBB5_9FIRM|nr:MULTISPECIES: 4-hydroxy-tetrahydrodipicolinate synthase [Tissierellales]MBE6082158.1 4-hydroxy-tetrahydrodipicolinate synthase [Tissierellaceae bacterium]QAT61322.1 4-hydroxy-tetrahydrodipicolinate synthase [Acidilutibacter cellobiosedens]SCL95088.1 4-hydroxy-tetrahydrodipicolinate synthase [Sporanaerobacter sp. PP17-6a]